MVCHLLPRHLESKGNLRPLRALQTDGYCIGARRQPGKIHADIEWIDPACLCFIRFGKEAAEFVDPLHIVNGHTPIETVRHSRIGARAFTQQELYHKIFISANLKVKRSAWCEPRKLAEIIKQPHRRFSVFLINHHDIIFPPAAMQQIHLPQLGMFRGRFLSYEHCSESHAKRKSKIWHNSYKNRKSMLFGNIKRPIPAIYREKRLFFPWIRKY